MSDKKHTENDPERTLITLDQLSQTIEVMTSVVNRLRAHLSQQIQARKAEIDGTDEALEMAAEEMNDLAGEIEVTTPTRSERTTSVPGKAEERESFIVEISRNDSGSKSKDDKTLH